MRIEVDPDALIAAGQRMGALGSQLSSLSGALGEALSGGIASGADAAGLNFGLKYGHQAEDFANAVADAANAFHSVGFLLEATGYNYKNADAASTIGGPGPAGGVSGEPSTTTAAQVPAGPNGMTVPPPTMWHLIQPLLQALPGVGALAGVAMTWPSGNSAMMGLTALQWRNLATGFATIEPQLAGIKSVVSAQSIPEGATVMSALDSLGHATSSLADVASSVAQAVSEFAIGVQQAQGAIRRLMDRLSFGGLWDTVTGFLTGEGDDILREVARDVGTVLNNFQQQVKGIVGLLEELTVLIGDAATAFQKWIRPILVEQFGDGVGGLLAEAVKQSTDFQIGALTGLINSVSGTVALADADTWRGHAAVALSVAQDPSTLPGVQANMAKEFVVWDKWSGENPGRAAGETAFNLGSLVVPGSPLSKTGSVTKGLSLTRRMFDERRLPQWREPRSWTRATPGVGGAPRVSAPASPGGRPSAPGAEGGQGQRAPVEQPGRAPSEAAPRPPAEYSPESAGSRAPESSSPTSTHDGGQAQVGVGPGQTGPTSASIHEAQVHEAGDRGTDAGLGSGNEPHGSGTEPPDAGGPVDTDHTSDPVHSDQERGDGWHRIEDKPDDPRYGEPLTHHWMSAEYPRLTDANQSTFDLVEHPDKPYGHDGSGNPLAKAQYDERYNLVGPEGERWANYAPNDGAVPGSRVVYDSGDAFMRDYGRVVDRIGEDSGRYLGVVPDSGPPSFESRSLPIPSLELPYHKFTLISLPEGWSIEVSDIAPAFGRDGGALQILVYDDIGDSMTITKLVEMGVIE